MAGEVPDDDRSQLRLVTLAQEPRVERNGAGQVGDILTVDGTVPGQLRERQVVRLQGEEGKAREPAGPERGEALLVPIRLATVTCWRCTP